MAEVGVVELANPRELIVSRALCFDFALVVKYELQNLNMAFLAL